MLFKGGTDDERTVFLRDSNVLPTKKVMARELGMENGVYIKFIDELLKYNISVTEWH